MKSEEQIDLYKAIKEFQKTEPLKMDLATTVADKIFVKRKIKMVVLDKWIYAFVAALVVIGLIYSFSLVNPSSLLSMLVLLIPIIFYIGLSIKEYKLLSKRFLSLI